MSFARRTFSQDIRERESEAHSGYCRVKGCWQKIHSFHHRLANTIINNKHFPMFMQSQFNCAGVCEPHHIHNAAVAGLNISFREAVAYEQYLEKEN